WERQDIPIVPPPVPVYTLSGIVTDIDSGEPLEEIAVEIYNISTAVSDWDTTLYDTTDEDGIYSFTESVSPGYVTMYARRDNYQIYTKLLIQYWSDRQFDFQLPKVAVAESYYVGFPEGYVTGMCWKDISTLAIIDTWTTVLESDGTEYPLRKIWESTNWGEFERISDDATVYNNREYRGLDFDGERYVALSRPTYLAAGEDILQDDGGIYFLSPTSQAILEHDTIPVSPSRVRDISLVGDELYIAAETRLVRWNLVTGDTLIVFNPEAWFTGIVVKDSVIYTYDDDYYAGNLVTMTREFQRLATYRVMTGFDYSERVELSGPFSGATDGICWGIGYVLGDPLLYRVGLQ
ncbi:MAG: carboxypeptidase-like regulatory domain-containing protein, partial [Fidelibacterota bacterium]